MRDLNWKKCLNLSSGGHDIIFFAFNLVGLQVNCEEEKEENLRFHGQVFSFRAMCDPNL